MAGHDPFAGEEDEDEGEEMETTQPEDSEDEEATAAATNYNIENSSFSVVTKQREKKQTIRRGRNECRTLTTTMTTPQ